MQCNGAFGVFGSKVMNGLIVYKLCRQKTERLEDEFQDFSHTF